MLERFALSAEKKEQLEKRNIRAYEFAENLATVIELPVAIGAKYGAYAVASILTAGTIVPGLVMGIVQESVSFLSGMNQRAMRIGVGDVWKGEKLVTPYEGRATNDLRRIDGYLLGQAASIVGVPAAGIAKLATKAAEGAILGVIGTGVAVVNGFDGLQSRLRRK